MSGTKTNTPSRVDTLFEKLVRAIRETSDHRITQLIQALDGEGYTPVLSVDVASQDDPAEPFVVTAEDQELLARLGVRFL
jgi:hypothetical protein